MVAATLSTLLFQHRDLHLAAQLSKTPNVCFSIKPIFGYWKLVKIYPVNKKQFDSYQYITLISGFFMVFENKFLICISTDVELPDSARFV